MGMLVPVSLDFLPTPVEAAIAVGVNGVAGGLGGALAGAENAFYVGLLFAMYGASDEDSDEDGALTSVGKNIAGLVVGTTLAAPVCTTVCAGWHAVHASRKALQAIQGRRARARAACLSEAMQRLASENPDARIVARVIEEQSAT